MRVSNLLHFTEHHRYYTYRGFSLSPLDGAVLHRIYQPMIGAEAIGLYLSMANEIPADSLGYSGAEALRNLIMAMGLDPGEQGRGRLAEMTSLLEGVGLLQSSRKKLEDEEEWYEFHLLAPLAPAEFFRNQHLVLLLRDRIGSHAVLRLQTAFFREAPAEAAGAETEDLTVPFYELFRIRADRVDRELEQALAETAADKQAEPAPLPAASRRLYEYADLISRFPRDSRNRAFVENLKTAERELDAVNYLAAKYFLTLQETVRLLDEDGVFRPDGALNDRELEAKAALNFRQNHKRGAERDRVIGRMDKLRPGGEQLAAGASPDEAVPGERDVGAAHYLEVPQAFKDKGDAREYNLMLRNSPYTHVLRLFFPGAVPQSALDLFEKLDLNYKLSEEVLNVLIHYIFMNELPLHDKYIDKLAAGLLGKRIATYEEAVDYFRQTRSTPAGGTGWNGRGSGGRGRQKPRIAMMEGGNSAAARSAAAVGSADRTGASAGTAADRGSAAMRELSGAELELILKKAERLDGRHKREP